MKARLSPLAASAARHPWLALLAALALALGVAARRVGPGRLFLTPDQHGRIAFQRGRYDEAARAFRDPMWIGAAQLKAKDFKAAAQTFCGLDTATSNYDCGNAFVMLGKYADAIDHYNRALDLRPDFADAAANRTLARLRAEKMTPQEGQPDTDPEEMGSPDERPQRTGETGEKAPEQPPEQTAGMGDESVRALWLKRVETKPADFLRSRFAYQLEAQAPAENGK